MQLDGIAPPVDSAAVRPRVRVSRSHLPEPRRPDMIRVWPGSPTPLGAHWDGEGTNFALFSEHATGVELCLFDRPEDAVEAHKIPLPQRTDQVWHAYLPDV